jgi:putative glutamine amidotransferase
MTETADPAERKQGRQMRRPAIGLTTYGIAHSDGFNIPREYVMAVVRAGGLPVLMPPATVDSTNRWIDMIRGLVLIGGGDVDPDCYGSPSHAAVYNVDGDRDAFEFDLAREAIRRKLPTLAICRGMQVVNVALGGTLHPHLPEVYGQTVAHRLPPRETVRHEVEVQTGALVAAAMGATRVDIVSWHHQAVHRLGEGLRAAAWAADGVVEAVEQDGNPNLLAVQWHPELSAAEDPTQQRLFDQLVAMAGRFSGMTDSLDERPINHE